MTLKQVCSEEEKGRKLVKKRLVLKPLALKIQRTQTKLVVCFGKDFSRLSLFSKTTSEFSSSKPTGELCQRVFRVCFLSKRKIPTKVRQTAGSFGGSRLDKFFIHTVYVSFLGPQAFFSTLSQIIFALKVQELSQIDRSSLYN